MVLPNSKRARKHKHTNGFFFFGLFKVAPEAYGGSQAKGQIRASTAGLCHSHSNTRSEPHLSPTPQLMTRLNPSPTKRGQGQNPHPREY